MPRSAARCVDVVLQEGSPPRYSHLHTAQLSGTRNGAVYTVLFTHSLARGADVAVITAGQVWPWANTASYSGHVRIVCWPILGPGRMTCCGALALHCQPSVVVRVTHIPNGQSGGTSFWRGRPQRAVLSGRPIRAKLLLAHVLALALVAGSGSGAAKLTFAPFPALPTAATSPPLSSRKR